MSRKTIQFISPQISIKRLKHQLFRETHDQELLRARHPCQTLRLEHEQICGIIFFLLYINCSMEFLGRGQKGRLPSDNRRCIISLILVLHNNSILLEHLEVLKHLQTYQTTKEHIQLFPRYHFPKNTFMDSEI